MGEIFSAITNPLIGRYIKMWDVLVFSLMLCEYVTFENFSYILMRLMSLAFHSLMYATVHIQYKSSIVQHLTKVLYSNI